MIIVNFAGFAFDIERGHSGLFCEDTDKSFCVFVTERKGNIADGATAMHRAVYRFI